MEARIFMKFETYVHKIVLDHQPNFHAKMHAHESKTRALAMPYINSDTSQQKSRKCVSAILAMIRFYVVYQLLTLFCLTSHLVQNSGNVFLYLIHVMLLNACVMSSYDNFNFTFGPFNVNLMLFLFRF